jgi:tetratricopeptide (TPR) repeat protein
MNSDRIEQLKRFLAQTPDDNFLVYALALEYTNAGEYKLAEALFQTLLVKYPDYIATYYHYGKLLELMGRPHLALEQYLGGISVAERQKDSKSLRELREAHYNLQMEI